MLCLWTRQNIRMHCNQRPRCPSRTLAAARGCTCACTERRRLTWVQDRLERVLWQCHRSSNNNGSTSQTKQNKPLIKVYTCYRLRHYSTGCWPIFCMIHAVVKVMI